MAAQRRGVQVLANLLRVEENRYQLDFNLIEEQLKTYRPTLWFFCSPHNPSGRIWREEEIRQCPISVNATARFWWSMRFTLNTFWMANSSVVSPLAVPPGQPDRAHIANKALKLGGLKTSYSMIPDDSLCQRFRQQLEKNSITSPNLFGVWGIILAYQHGLPRSTR